MATTVDATTVVPDTIKPNKKIDRTKEVLYSFYRVQNSAKKDNGYICVAVLPPKSGKSKFRVGLSFCSPEDTLNKRRGRSIAAGRLFSTRKGRNFIVNIDASSYNDASYLSEVCSAAIMKSLKTKTEKGGKNFRLIGGTKKPLWYAPDWLRNSPEFKIIPYNTKKRKPSKKAKSQAEAVAAA